jgi:hypothetical protein
MKKGGNLLQKTVSHMNLRWLILIGGLAAGGGCSLMPRPIHQPTVHNPFPQLSRVAIAPFFNLSREPTLDGRNVANAYYNELQLIPGFEVVPTGVVEQTMIENRIELRGPDDARRLARLLQADALVVGAVTDYSPYYPPRMGLQVEWYAANPCFHPIPPGYGLPWGTPEEQQIPGPLVLEAQFALAKEQLKTQTPEMPPLADSRPGDAKGAGAAPGGVRATGAVAGSPASSPSTTPTPPSASPTPSAAMGAAAIAAATAGTAATAATGVTSGTHGSVPPDWPDPRGFVPPPPRSQPPVCWPNDGPVMRHTRTYNGNDSDFTTALSTYYSFRDEARLDGWQGYLQRSDDFIRFCCHMHIWEMLTARGGAGETRVVWRWPTIR